MSYPWTYQRKFMFLLLTPSEIEIWIIILLLLKWCSNRNNVHKKPGKCKLLGNNDFHSLTKKMCFEVMFFSSRKHQHSILFSNILILIFICSDVTQWIKMTLESSSCLKMSPSSKTHWLWHTIYSQSQSYPPETAKGELNKVTFLNGVL